MLKAENMSKVKINSGICGFVTEVKTKTEDYECSVEITSDCPSVQVLAKHLKKVDPMQEIMYRGEGPLTLSMAKEHLPHPSCPVPIGILKAIEVESHLALPKDPTITIEKDG